ncbi:protein toll-like [Saccostrea echinata]|uniref:protein toll-like n=1 Tax=Saccostrea echinata TaxID=191078 RepID=UPI002A81ECD1|nr:protein toll-like [Saccostrea echinata]
MDILKVTLVLQIVSFVSGANVTGFHSWKSENGSEKPNVLCPDFCFLRDTHFYDRCCACEGKPIWHLDSNLTYFPLFVEYVNSFGRSNIVGNDSSSSFHWVIHEYERLSRLPDNLCEFNNTLVTLKLKGNRIQSIEGINCTNFLDFLDLSENSISAISNETFSGMPNLRILFLTNTNIKTVGPNTFNSAGTEIFVTDLSNNTFLSYDVSNVYFERRAFCNITMVDCNITFVIKEEKTLQTGVKYGGGEVVLADSTINHHPVQLIFGSSISSLRNIYKYDFNGRFTFKKLVIPCDCNLGALLGGDMAVFKRFYHLDDDLYTCSSPEHLKKFNVLNVFNDSSLLDMFVCHKQKFCPSSCSCIEQPSRYRMIVDCSNQNLTSLPSYLPETIYNIELNCSNNAIKEVEPVNYLKNITVLDLSGNQVTEISDKVPSRLKSLENLYLTDHSLPKLTRGFADIDASKVWFGRNSVPCSCQEKWIKAWRLGSQVNSSNPLLCRTDSNGILRAEVAFDSCIENEFDKTFFALFLLPATALMAMVIAKVFRFDAIIIKSRFTKNKNTNFCYDVYVLFDDTNSDIIKYVLDVFRYLQHNGYKCFVPPIHEEIGDVRDVQLYENIKKSRSVLAVLSMPKDGDDINEVLMGMNHAWCLFSNNEIENIIAVVFEGKLAFHKKRFSFLGALNRFKRVFKVTSRKYRVKQKLTEALPIPNQDKTNTN